MSWCRFIEADLYVFESASHASKANVEGAGLIECCGCWLGYDSDGRRNEPTPRFDLFEVADFNAFVAHLCSHVDAGHDVPFERLLENAVEHRELLLLEHAGSKKAGQP